MKNSLTLFEDYPIRRHYDEKTENWYFSVVDIIKALTQQSDHQAARKYWNKLSERLKSEGSQVVTNCHRLKMKAEDGKMRLTDAANPETILRLIQSVPSPKAEPIKLWLAKVGHERLQEIQDPEQSVNRARENWKRHGMSEKWIQQRMMGQETRNKLTDPKLEPSCLSAVQDFGRRADWSSFVTHKFPNSMYAITVCTYIAWV